MEYLLNEVQMKTIDTVSIEEYGIPSLVLMERAALAVATRIKENIGESDKILVMCTSGNNGGDGLAIARILTIWGYEVEVLLVGNFDRGTEENKKQLEIVRNLGITIINNAKISSYNIVVDAIFGVGLNKPITGEIEKLVEEVNQCANVVFSVDIPSGIHAGSGQILGSCIKADYTITFGYKKLGLILYPGCDYVGKLYCEEVGFVPEAINKAMPRTFSYEKSDLKRLPKRPKRSNKGTFGKVLVIAGSPNMSGACYLSAKAAYRSGAGLVKILTAKENQIILQTSLPEAILATYDDVLKEEDIEKELDWATVIVFGPGIGISQVVGDLLQLVLTKAKVPVILDADGLNLLAMREDKEEILSHLSEDYILTPHLMEMSRLVDTSLEQVREDVLKAAVEMVSKTRCNLVLKDARTIVATEGKVYVNQSGNQGMATAGSGDVLTGIIAGMITGGMTSFEAACLGVYVHGLAGDAAREKKGTYSLMAEDIIDGISEVLKKADME